MAWGIHHTGSDAINAGSMPCRGPSGRKGRGHRDLPPPRSPLPENGARGLSLSTLGSPNSSSTARWRSEAGVRS